MNKGFILVEYLISLLLGIMLFILIISNIKIYYKNNINYDIQDEIMIYKTRKMLALASDIDVYENYLRYNYRNNYQELVLINEHLIIQPGVQIILEDLDSVYFEQILEDVYLNYCRLNKCERRKIID